MSLVSRVLARCGAALVLAIFAAAPARAQFGSDLNGMTVAASANLPAGWLADNAGTGFGVSLRQGGHDTDTWSGRGVFGFDYFTGKGVVSDVQMIQFGFDIVHHSNRSFYQFGGVGLATTRIATNGTGSTLVTSRDQNFGFTGGVGVNYGSDDLKWFLEFAASTYIRSGGNISWIPVRIGLRF